MPLEATFVRITAGAYHLGIMNVYWPPPNSSGRGNVSVATCSAHLHALLAYSPDILVGDPNETSDDRAFMITETLSGSTLSQIDLPVTRHAATTASTPDFAVLHDSLLQQYSVQ
eukprot:5444883-Amphidinium_carterae.1